MRVGELLDELKKYPRRLEVVMGEGRLPVGGVESIMDGTGEKVWIIPDIESLFREYDDLVFYPAAEEKIIKE